jgi:DNA processing protein
VFAVPGNITSKASWGPNLLIKQGAKIVQDWNDVVVELPADSRRHLIEKGRGKLLGTTGESVQPGQTSLLNDARPQIDGTARKALEALHADAATQLDNLLEKLEDTSASEVIAALFELEMLGLVKQLPGRNFVKVW